MTSPSVRWSEEKQKDLQALLSGMWAEDEWVIQPHRKDGKPHRHHYHFLCISPSLNIELKYAFWQKLERGEWKIESNTSQRIYFLHHFVVWLNEVAPHALSLLERDLDVWVISLRSYLVRIDRYRPQKSRRLLATQEYDEHVGDSNMIHCFRQVYKILQEAYRDDDRPETEKDIWDLRKIHADLNPTVSHYHLNFTTLSQPWLRELAKRFMRYRLSIRSAGDCQNKLQALTIFSDFLAKLSPTAHAPDINRQLIVRFMNYLRERYPDKPVYRNKQLGALRTVIRTWAYDLQIEGVTREEIVFEADFVKVDLQLVEEIPSEVLVQMKEHFESLPTGILRMLIVNLACGLRINELCTLPLHCISADSQGKWTLFCYQRKKKAEHCIPIVDDQIIATIQAQQEEVMKQWGKQCPFLFPSLSSPKKPFQQLAFGRNVNIWIVKNHIRTQDGKLYRFTSHRLRHTVAMELLDEGVSLHTIRRILGHNSIAMTERYAYRRESRAREELEQKRRRDVTIDANLEVVLGDSRAEDPDIQLLHKGLNSAILPVGGCGRLRVNGLCDHLNRCYDCLFWRTSTSDVPKLEQIIQRNQKLLPMARTTNTLLATNIERELSKLVARLARHKQLGAQAPESVEQQLAEYRLLLTKAEAGLQEAQQASLWGAVQTCERTVTDLKGRIAELEMEQRAHDS